MKNYRQPFYFALIVLVTLLTACAPADTDINADELATVVAGTLAAQPTDTSAPVEPSATPENLYGSCANTGLLSLAYIKDGNIWLWVEGGATTQLTNSADVGNLRISQDGCRIAYSRVLPNPAYDPNAEFGAPSSFDELWVVSSDGSGNQKLAGAEFFATLAPPEPNSAYSIYKFAWQPGSHTLAFGTRLVFGGPGLATNNDIHLVDANTLALSTLLPAGQGGDFYFSPDGQQIAFSTHVDISVINTAGSNLRADLISFPTVITYSEYLYSPPISWGPASDALMVAVPPEDGLAAPVVGVYPETALWYIPLDGTPAFQAGAIQNVWFAGSEVQFSPDNGRIAYLRPVGEPELNLHEFVVALSDGSNESVVLEIPSLLFGDWSPDSTRYIYTLHEVDFQLWMGNVADENVLPISQLTAFSATAAQVQWVEDETFILLVQGDAGAELSVMQTSGAGVMVDAFGQPFVAFDISH